MRILAVGNMYPPRHLGGYELVWRSAMRHLRARGHEARVLSTDYRSLDTGPDDPDTFRELRWYWSDHAYPYVGWRARLALEHHNAEVIDRHVAEFAPDVVSWWSMGGMSLSMIERVRRAGLPAVAFVHDDWLVYGPRVDRWTRAFRGRRRRWLAPFVERLTGLPARVELERSARYVFVSETVRARARLEGYEFGDSAIAHSGIDEALLRRLGSDLEEGASDRPWTWRLLFVGRLDERKGLDDAVTALAQLPKQATLTVAGGGSEAEAKRVEAVASSCGVLERVRLLGMCSREQLVAEYEAADVVVFPARWREPWGLVPLEAMALGRPVVATAEGGPSEYLIDGGNAVVVQAADSWSIVRGLRRVAEDPQLRRQLRTGGLETSRQYTEQGFNRAVEAELVRAGAAPS